MTFRLWRCFGLCRHKISTASPAGTVVASIISTNVIFFGFLSCCPVVLLYCLSLGLHVCFDYHPDYSKSSYLIICSLEKVLPSYTFQEMLAHLKMENV